MLLGYHRDAEGGNLLGLGRSREPSESRIGGLVYQAPAPFLLYQHLHFTVLGA